MCATLLLSVGVLRRTVCFRACHGAAAGLVAGVAPAARCCRCCCCCHPTAGVERAVGGFRVVSSALEAFADTTCSVLFPPSLGTTFGYPGAVGASGVVSSAPGGVCSHSTHCVCPHWCNNISGSRVQGDIDASGVVSSAPKGVRCFCMSCILQLSCSSMGSGYKGGVERPNRLLLADHTMLWSPLLKLNRSLRAGGAVGGIRGGVERPMRCVSSNAFMH
jgi:hypothetical protein